MSQPRARRRHPATGLKEDQEQADHNLVPLTVAMESIRLWSYQEESQGQKREEKSEETVERGSVSPRTVGG